MKFKYWPHLLILLLAVLVRFAKLDLVPSSLYYDEIDLGYQVQSLLQTGKDYRGSISPFYFRSFNTDKTPIPILASILPALLFKSPEFQVRVGTAFVGVLVVLMSMLISFQLTNSKVASFITGLVFAFSPWQIQFSRMAFEAEHLLLFLLIYVYFLLNWLETKSVKPFYLSAVCLGLMVYTYRTASFLSPTLLVITPLFFFKDFTNFGFKKTIYWLAIVTLLVGPFLYATTIGSKDKTRINQISIFSDPLVPIEVMRSRELVSGNFQNQTLGQAPTLWSKVFHNKPLSFFDRFKSNTFKNFSMDFLYLKGDPNGRHSPKNSGELIFVDIVALVAGLSFVFNKAKDKRFSYLIFLLFWGAIPSNLTIDGATHASRLISFSGPLLIIVSLGYFSIYKNFVNIKYGKLTLVGITAIWIFAVLQYLNVYFIHFPITNSREFGYGFKQAVNKIGAIEKDYTRINLTVSNDPPIIYYLFWNNISPLELQKYGTEFNRNIFKNLPLDRVRPYVPEQLFCEGKQILLMDPKTLYLVSYKNLPKDFRSAGKDPIPQGIKLLDVIKYPDNEVAFYLITRDSKNGKVVLPLKDQNCK